MGSECLVFVHGWATDSYVWNLQKEAFSGSAMVCCVDLPGHGGVRSWHEPNLKNAIREVTESLPQRPVTAIGWSLGGQVLLKIAAENPDRFKSLILVNSTPSFTTKKDFPYGQSRALIRRMVADMKKDAGGTVDRFYPLNFTDAEKELKAVGEFLERYKYPGPISCDIPDVPGCMPTFKYDELTAALESLMETDLRDLLPEVKVPTLIIYGTEDEVTPIGSSEYLAEHIEGARLEIFEGQGHAPFITDSERFNKLIVEFVEGLNG